jgi:hypothetical protein
MTEIVCTFGWFMLVVFIGFPFFMIGQWLGLPEQVCQWGAAGFGLVGAGLCFKPFFKLIDRLLGQGGNDRKR